MQNRQVLVCCGPGCIANDSLKVLDEFQKALADKTHINVAVDTKDTGCQGLCELGPLVRILPDDISYIRVKAKDVAEIVEKTLLKGELVERLLYNDSACKKKLPKREEWPFYRKQYKIALRNVGEINPSKIEEYLERGGYQSLKKVLTGMTPLEVIEEIKKSGLRGRGGGGFPTGVKWQSANRASGDSKYVICNGDEGDPGAFMDRAILEGNGHSVLEGMAICAYAIGAKEGFLYIRDEYGLAVENMRKAIAAAREKGFLGKKIFGTDFSFDAEIVRGGGAFVCGESTALMASIEGKVGEPRAKYIRSVEKGLWGQPTVLNNVETFANIPPIINRGADWFRSIGTEKSPGTKVFALVGKVKNTGLVEVPMGITLRELIFDIGGGISGNRKFKAVQTGGPSGGCIPEKKLDLPVDFDTLDAEGSMMGSGGMIVIDDQTCMVEFARYYLNFLSEESCGKCAPCREGVKNMLAILNDICEGNGKEGDIELLEEIGAMVQVDSLCGLGKSAPNPVLSNIMNFREEFEAHIRDKRCPAGVCKKLTKLYIDEDACTGCGACVKVCPVAAISGQKKQAHVLDEAKCINCDSCRERCAFDAIRVR